MDGGAAQDLEAGLGGIVHEDEGYAVVVVQVAGGDVLLVAAEVGESDGAVVEDVDEAGRATAVLNVRPAGFAGGGHVEGVAGGYEVALGFGEAVAGVAGLFDARRRPERLPWRVCCCLTKGVKAILAKLLPIWIALAVRRWRAAVRRYSFTQIRL